MTSLSVSQPNNTTNKNQNYSNCTSYLKIFIKFYMESTIYFIEFSQFPLKNSCNNYKIINITTTKYFKVRQKKLFCYNCPKTLHILTKNKNTCENE